MFKFYLGRIAIDLSSICSTNLSSNGKGLIEKRNSFKL